LNPEHLAGGLVAANTNTTAAITPPALGSGYAVQVTSERSEKRAQATFRSLQAKYPNQLNGREPLIRRADLGAAGIYYRALVGPFASAERAAKLCRGLKAAGGDCIIQKN
jgi:cell division septation protein DedD